MARSIIIPLLLALLAAPLHLLSAQDRPVELLKQQAEKLLPHMESEFGIQFLQAADRLPLLEESRIVYYNRETGEAYSETDASTLTESELEGFQRLELGEQFYYNTMFGTPLAAARAIDLAGMAGMPDSEPLKILDYGFGSIGQLRLLMEIGCDVTGIEVSPVLQAFYDDKKDTSRSSGNSSASPSGGLRMLYGYFPADSSLTRKVGEGYDLFISKNTLKKGYVTPEQKTDPRSQVDIGMSSDRFLAEINRVLNRGGLFLIYNLSPAREKEGEAYNPQADGRSPFTRTEFEQAGFEIIDFNSNDTPFAHRMAEIFGWDREMNLETDLTGIYTLVRKK